MRKAALHNLGCKVNAYETEAMAQLLKEAGYEIVPFEEKADVYVINTCTVTNIADKKSRQMLHRAKKRNPEAVVVAAGCYVQVAADRLQGDDAVDVIIGNNRKKDLVRILEEYFAAETSDAAGRSAQAEERRHLSGADRLGQAQENRHLSEADRTPQTEERHRMPMTDGQTTQTEAEKSSPSDSQSRNTAIEAEPAARRTQSGSGFASVIDIASDHEYESLSISTTAEHTRAFIKIQDGCNQFCSYCIIPYARGRVRSRAAADILKEAETLVGAGYREIVVTGIHISSYGMDMPEETRLKLIDLLEMLDGVKGLSRLRLGSLEPRIVTEDFVRRIAALRTICPHFHLSLQSGCDATLKRMNRHYTAEEYAAGCSLLRRYFDRPAITTDVIVGFPGETEEEFAQTVSFLKKIGFYELHVFPYSRREGTRAALMPDQVDEAVKKERSACLLRMDAEASLAYRRLFLGEEREVLMEETVTAEGAEYLVGHTREYVKAVIPWEENMRGRIVRGRMEKMVNEELVLLTHVTETEVSPPVFPCRISMQEERR